MKITKLKIITPNGVFLEKNIEIITLKTTEGYKGLQYGIQPFVASIVPSKTFIKSENKEEIIYIKSAIVYAQKELITIISDSVSYDSNIIDINDESNKTHDTKAKSSIEDVQKEIQIKKEIEKAQK
ncbi:hypothetical protein [Mycoplasma sp. 1012]